MGIRKKEEWRKGRLRKVLFKNLPNGAVFFIFADRNGNGYRKINPNLRGNARRTFDGATCTRFSEGKEVFVTETEMKRAKAALPPVSDTEVEIDV